MFDSHNTGQPGLVFICNGNEGIIVPKGPVRGVPDLVIEVLPPSTRADDLGPKLRMEQRFGAPDCWVVDRSAQTVQTFELRDGVYVAGPPLGRDDPLACPLFPDVSAPVFSRFE